MWPKHLRPARSLPSTINRPEARARFRAKKPEMSFYRCFKVAVFFARTVPFACVRFVAAVFFFFLIFSASPKFLFSQDAKQETNKNQSAAVVFITMPLGQRLRVEVAADEAARMRGLMYREKLEKESGMLFVFEREQVLSFWMKNTLIPLSIAFLNAQGMVVRLADMRPLSTETISSQKPAQYALEVPQGAFARYGITVGSTLEIPASVRAK